MGSARHARHLQLVVDPAIIMDGDGYERVLAAMRAGVDSVQVRGPHASSRSMLAAVQRLRPQAAECEVALLVNDRIDVALAVNADGGPWPIGVHLGGRSLPVEMVRRAFPALPASVSVHSVEEGIAAARNGDPPVAITLGHIFATPSHPGEEPLGLDPLRSLAEAVDVPVIAIGGIDASNVRAVVEAGAAGIAVISAILRADDPARATADLRAILDLPAPSPPSCAARNHDP